MYPISDKIRIFLKKVLNFKRLLNPNVLQKKIRKILTSKSWENGVTGAEERTELS